VTSRRIASLAWAVAVRARAATPPAPGEAARSPAADFMVCGAYSRLSIWVRHWCWLASPARFVSMLLAAAFIWAEVGNLPLSGVRLASTACSASTFWQNLRGATGDAGV